MIGEKQTLIYQNINGVATNQPLFTFLENNNIIRPKHKLDPNVKSFTGGSATGLFQFIKSTWKSMVNKYGKQYGISMGDIRNPRANSIMGALLYKENASYLKRKLGREPSLAEVYMAHFSGMGGAVKLIKAMQRNPNAPASSVYSPTAIKNNQALLKGKTLQQIYDKLESKVLKAQRRFK